MTSCCSNPIDLGCSLSCEDLILPISDFEGTIYEVFFDMNGATQKITAVITNGVLPIDSNLLPESANITLRVNDSQGVFVSCFNTQRKVQL